MTKQLLRDRAGRLLGWIETDSRGKQYLRDKAGRLLGWYDPALGSIYDRAGRLVGRSNILLTLLPVRP